MKSLWVFVIFIANLGSGLSYIYGCSLVLLDAAKEVKTATDHPPPLNPFAHLREFILKVLKIEDRYYVFPIYEAWANVFKSIGTRTTGDDKGNYLLFDPEGNRTFPSGVKPIRSNLVWVIGRIELREAKDYASVHAIQDQFELAPLSSFGKEFHPPKSVPFSSNNTGLEPSLGQVENRSPEVFFERLSFLLKENPLSLRMLPL